MRVPITLTVNSVERRAEVEPRTLLVQYLRNELALTGAHIGCETSQCGACTVLMDGQAVKSCTILAVQADGSSVTTIEGLARSGLCTLCSRRSGMSMAAVRVLHAGHGALHSRLADDPDPSEESIRHG